ncbi:hypothetical protein Patl1_07058 [Pistacia atlantica]|uniref:Uncharacterized protein n=1 Tax=Pistacia atlantica TaxID=434234 RepID=A0ACC1ALD9_9ROSI|nr:hypothetical protein Patl1_07058 [Pistacia atlantica]
MEIFSKILSNTDITKRLGFPTIALNHFSFPEEDHHYVHFLVNDSSTQNGWKFRLSKRQNSNYPKPAMTGDWLKFVETRGLKQGDQVILRKLVDEAGGVNYSIAVRKMIKLFGNVIYVDQDEAGA